MHDELIAARPNLIRRDIITLHRVLPSGRVAYHEKLQHLDAPVFLRNGVFHVDERLAAPIAEGGSKAPCASVLGELIAELPEGLDEGVRVGFDPRRSLALLRRGRPHPAL